MYSLENWRFILKQLLPLPQRNAPNLFRIQKAKPRLDNYKYYIFILEKTQMGVRIPNDKYMALKVNDKPLISEECVAAF